MAEEPVEDGGGATPVDGGLVGVLELGEDLRLADDHRVEARGHAEQVGDGGVVAARVGGDAQLGGVDATKLGQPPQSELLGPLGVVGEEIEFGAVAGRHNDGLGHDFVRGQLARHTGGRVAGQGEPLAQLERRRLVRYANDEQVHVACYLPQLSKRLRSAIRTGAFPRPQGRRLLRASRDASSTASGRSDGSRR